MGPTAAFVTLAGQVAGAQGGLAVFEDRAVASGSVSNTTSDGLGGRIIFQGTPAELLKARDSRTAEYLRHDSRRKTTKATG